MTTTPATWTEETIHIAGADLHIKKSGSGAPLLVLHGEMGQPGWLRYHEELARHYTVYAPSHPGFGVTDRLDWVMNMRDLAGWYLRALEELGMEDLNVLGFSLGGWLAAEMTAQCPHHFKKMALVGPAGIQPPVGEILDMFLIVSKQFITAGFMDPEGVQEFQTLCPEEPSPEQVELWETAREEACRLSWRPYMFDHSLPHRLRLLKNMPALIVAGQQDAVVPISVAEAYKGAIAGSKVALIGGSGHRPEVEKTEEFVTLISEFFA